jgi:formate dehydrogenase subunit delta
LVTTESVVRMANQIAGNFRHLGADDATLALTAHLRTFWAPSMRAELVRHVAAGGPGLDQLVVAAARRLPETIPANAENDRRDEHGGTHDAP